MLLLSFVSKGQTVMASETPKWCIGKQLGVTDLEINISNDI